MKKFRRLKYNILFYFVLFTVIIISCLWVFQIGLFEGYYQNLKIRNMKTYGNILRSSTITNEDFAKAELECSELGISVYLIDVHKDFVEYNVTEEEKELLKIAISSYENKEQSETEIYGLESLSKSSKGFFYYATKLENNNKCYLILTSSHAKLIETIMAIKWQLIAVSIIVGVIGVVLAYVVSAMLSKPIDDMSHVAKKWAEGNDEVVFKNDGQYAEINELADTLNYAKDSVSKTSVLQRDLLANVSHDLKTPLTMIKAYAEMIRDISGENKQKRDKHTQVIMDEADRLAMLVNDILNLSKLQSGVDDLNLTEVNLSDLTERVIGRFEPFVENQGFTIENHVSPNLISYVDEAKIEQVIYNLLGNSINYTGDDKTVKVFLTAEKDKIILEIIDSGKGISKEKIDSIWERYYRFSETNTRPVKGTGLGLSIVKTILDNHKLRFGVRSKKDFGSNFYVEFNRVRNEQ